MDSRIESVLPAATLNTASYIRWVEIRTKKIPSVQMIHSFIRGLLDQKMIPHTSKDIEKIELLSWTVDPKTVEAYMLEMKMLDEFDASVERSNKYNKPN